MACTKWKDTINIGSMFSEGVMKAGEAGVVTSVLVLLTGGIFVGFTQMPEPPITEGAYQQPEEMSVYDQLKLAIQPYHFGNLPRESFRGDTTVWVVDLDHNMYTIPQVDLHVTRELRELEFNGITAAERAAGGLVFNAVFPNGQPLEIQFTCP